MENIPFTLLELVNSAKFSLAIIAKSSTLIGAERNRLTDRFTDEASFLRTLPGDYQSIGMGKLPKGLELQGGVHVIVEVPPGK